MLIQHFLKYSSNSSDLNLLLSNRPLLTYTHLYTVYCLGISVRKIDRCPRDCSRMHSLNENISILDFNTYNMLIVVIRELY